MSFDAKGGPQLDYLGNSLARVDRLAVRGGDSLGSLSSQFAEVGVKASAMGAAVTGAMTKLVVDAAKLEYGVAEIRTILGPDSLLSDPSITGIVKKYQVEYGRAGTEITSAFYQALSSGIPEKGIDTFLGTALKLARAGVTQPETGVRALTAVMNSYNMEVDRAGEVGGKLMKTVDLGQTKLQLLGDNIGKVGKNAYEAGMQFEEMLAFIALATQPGSSTDMAVESLNATLRAVMKPPPKALTVAEKLGVDFSTAGLRAKGFHGFLKDIFKSMDDAHLNDQAKQRVFTDLFSESASMRTMIGFLSDEEMAKFDKFTEQIIANGDAALDWKDSIMAGTTQEEWNRNMERFSALSEELGQHLLPIANELLGTVNELLDKFTRWSMENPELAGTLTVVTAKAGLLLTAVGGISIGLAGIASIKGLASIAAGLGGIGGTAGRAATSVMGLGGAFSAGLLGVAGAYVSELIDKLINLKELGDDLAEAWSKETELDFVFKKKFAQEYGVKLPNQVGMVAAQRQQEESSTGYLMKRYVDSVMYGESAANAWYSSGESLTKLMTDWSEANVGERISGAKSQAEVEAILAQTDKFWSKGGPLGLEKDQRFSEEDKNYIRLRGRMEGLPYALPGEAHVPSPETSTKFERLMAYRMPNQEIRIIPQSIVVQLGVAEIARAVAQYNVETRRIRMGEDLDPDDDINAQHGILPRG